MEIKFLGVRSESRTLVCSCSRPSFVKSDHRRVHHVAPDGLQRLQEVGRREEGKLCSAEAGNVQVCGQSIFASVAFLIMGQ